MTKPIAKSFFPVGQWPFLMLLLISLIILLACWPNPRILNSAKREAKPTPVSTPPPNSLEADIKAMKTADFNFIYVFKRKDGEKLDADDRRFINANKPMEINRVRISDNERAVIFGSNFRLPDENLKNLSERYKFMDHSKPESEIMNGK